MRGPAKNFLISNTTRQGGGKRSGLTPPVRVGEIATENGTGRRALYRSRDIPYTTSVVTNLSSYGFHLKRTKPLRKYAYSIGSTARPSYSGFTFPGIGDRPEEDA
jgi:hypothetical protein